MVAIPDYRLLTRAKPGGAPGSQARSEGSPAAMAVHGKRADGLYALLYDTLRSHGHRPGLHLVGDEDDGHRRAWLNAAGFGALGHTVEHAARLYVQAGSSLASDPELRDELRRLGRQLAA